MAVQVSWHTFQWGYSSRCIRTVEDLSTSQSVDIERNEDKEGKPATQTVALSLASLSFSYTVSAFAGGNPRREYGDINGCLGVHAPLFLNGTRFLVNEMMLKSVDASDWVLNGQGQPVSVKISLKFEEYSVEASGLKSQKNVRNGALRPGLQTANNAQSALTVGPTAAQKSAHIITNPQMNRW